MWKKIRRILMLVLAAVFLFCGVNVAVVKHQYNVSKRLYKAASDTFTAPAVPAAEKPEEEEPEEEEKKSVLDDGIERLPEQAPIEVNFDALLAINPDVIGWIYCEDTVIDYPVMHGATNDTYLHHSFDGSYNISGSIFSDEENLPGFVDPLTILYGHHMASGAMFAVLRYWHLSEFFNEHPVMWILTPTQDYKVELYSCYDTSAYSNTYTVFHGWGDEFTEYLHREESHSGVHTDVELDPYGHYVVLSTCAYAFEDARTVLHGRLRPVMSAGGVPLE